MIIHDEPGDSEPMRCHSRLVVGQSKNLALTVLNLVQCDEDRQPYCGWHGIAVSTLEGNVRICSPSGLRHPGDEHEFDPFWRSAPEMRHPTVLVSGFKDLENDILPDCVHAMQALAPTGDETPELPVVFGLSNNELRVHFFRPRWQLRSEAQKTAESYIAEFSSISELLGHLQKTALNSLYWRAQQLRNSSDQDNESRINKYALIEIIPRLWRRLGTDEDWQGFFLLVWDVLARGTPGYLAVSMIQALRRVQYQLAGQLPQGCNKRLAQLEEHISRIRKFVLDPGHFSGKRTRFSELTTVQDPGLEDERVVYLSILMARRHDPIFIRDFDPSEVEAGFLGEILTFTPISPIEGRKFWEVEEPRLIRFLASNYHGQLWLLDGEGGSLCLLWDSRSDDSGGNLGDIVAVYPGRDDFLLSFSGGRMRRLPAQSIPFSTRKPIDSPLRIHEVEGIGQRPVKATAFAAVLTNDAGEQPGVLWGDASGEIHRLGRTEPLYQPPSDALRANAIQHLAWFQCRWPDHEEPYVLAATSAGQLILFRWDDGRSSPLREVTRLQLGNLPVSTFLVTGPDNRHFVAARYDTAVGLKLLGDSQNPRLGLIWSFRTGGTVQSIQPVGPEIGAGSWLVLVGSHDAHLYALDLEGRHLETYFFRWDPLRREPDSEEGFKIGHFVTAKKHEPDDDSSVLIRVYACAFENRYIGVRLIDRPKMLSAFDGNELQRDPGSREASLTRWRAYHVAEGHLRHRFIRQSQRYPGTEPELILKAIEWLLEAGDSSLQLTGEMTALLRRLFQGSSPGSSKCGVPDRPGIKLGLHGLLEDPKLYRRAISLLLEFEKRWDTPNSVANRRVRLFWIRSLLREIRDRESFRNWLRTGLELATQEPLAQPERLLRHFLEKSPRLVQHKTLQYLERMLFGWPGVRQSPLFDKGGAKKGDMEWLLDALFFRLASRPEEVSQQEPNPVVFQIARLLCLLVRDRHLDPLFLTYLIQRHEVPLDIYRIVEDQWESIGDQESKQEKESRGLDPATVFSQARRLDEALERGAPLKEIVTHLEGLIDRPWPSFIEEASDADYLVEAHLHFAALMPLLKVETLQELGNVEMPAEDAHQAGGGNEGLRYFSSYPVLTHLSEPLAAVQQYFVKKFEDQWVEPVMTHLRFEHYDRVKREWQQWREEVESLIEEKPVNLARREARLLSRLLEHWEGILIFKERLELLKDFQFAVDKHCLRDLEPRNRFDSESLNRVRKEKELAITVVSNLFTRLVLFFEPQEAAFLYHLKDEEAGILGAWFDRNDPSKPILRSSISKDKRPGWLPESWLQVNVFEQLDGDVILSHCKEERIHHWEMIPIFGTTDEKSPLAFYIFGWEGIESVVHYETHQLEWMMPLQALVYRRAAVEQVELIGQGVFHHRPQYWLSYLPPPIRPSHPARQAAGGPRGKAT